MEMQQPPQKPISTIIVSNCSNNNRPNKTLLTEREKQQILSQIKTNLVYVTKNLNKLTKRFDLFVEEFDGYSSSTNNQLARIYQKSNRLKKKIETFQPRLFIEDIQKGINALSTENFEAEDYEIDEESTNDNSLNFNHSLQFGEKFEQLEEKIESSQFFIRNHIDEECSKREIQSLTIEGIQEDITELKEDIALVKAQTECLTTYLTTTREDIKTELTQFQEAINKKTISLENIILEQQQSISTLRRWLMAIGGGSAIALTIWLWHYIHNK